MTKLAPEANPYAGNMTPIPRHFGGIPKSASNFNPLSAGVQAGSSVIGAVAGAIGAHKQRKHQRYMQQQQFNFAREMFDKTNAWNSPANQVKLKREAGLNPYYDGSNPIVGATAPTAGGAPSAPPALGAEMLGRGVSSLGSLINESGNVSAALQQARSAENNSMTAYTKALSDISKIKNDIVRDNALVSIEQQRADQEFQESVARIGEMAQNVLTSKAVEFFNNVKSQETAVSIVRDWLDSAVYRSYTGKLGRNVDSDTLLKNFDAWIKKPEVTLSAAQQQLLQNPKNKEYLAKLARFSLEEPALRFEMDKVMNQELSTFYNRLGFGAVAGGVGNAFNLLKYVPSRGGSSSSSAPRRSGEKGRYVEIPRDPNKRGAQKKYRWTPTN